MVICWRVFFYFVNLHVDRLANIQLLHECMGTLSLLIRFAYLDHSKLFTVVITIFENVTLGNAMTVYKFF